VAADRDRVGPPAPSPEVDRYLEALPPDQREGLGQLRAALRQALPGAREEIRYAMPAFVAEEVLVYYAANRGHLGFYPTASGIARFQAELAAWPCSKGAVRLSWEEPLPLDLLVDIARFRAEESRAKPRRRHRRGADSA